MDSFGLGCVLAELSIGSGLFYRTSDRLERLALLERVLGPFPLDYVESLKDRAAFMFVFEEIGSARVARVAFFKQGFSCLEAHGRVRRTIEALSLSVSVSSF